MDFDAHPIPIQLEDNIVSIWGIRLVAFGSHGFRFATIIAGALDKVHQTQGIAPLAKILTIREDLYGSSIRDSLRKDIRLFTDSIGGFGRADVTVEFTIGRLHYPASGEIMTVAETVTVVWSMLAPLQIHTLGSHNISTADQKDYLMLWAATNSATNSDTANRRLIC